MILSPAFCRANFAASLQEMDAQIEEAAWSLGASDLQTFWRVILRP
jgi:sulfate transport system permease protein